MSDSSRRRPFSQAAQLRSGTPMLLRVLGPQDREKIVAPSASSIPSRSTPASFPSRRNARHYGFQRFEAEVLAGNLPMLSVFERSGLPLAKKKEDGVVHVAMELGPAGAAH